MLTFADTAWQVVLIALVLLTGFWIALTQKRLFGIAPKTAVFYFVWHTMFSAIAYWYSLNNASDATFYYLRSFDRDVGFDVSTKGITFITSFFSRGLGMSYGGVYLTFGIAGYVGMLAVASALASVTFDKSPRIRRLAHLTLLVPGLSFWSGILGKESLTFLGTGLALWAALDIRGRYRIMAVSSFIYLFPRPHIAGILLLALAAALIFSSGIGRFRKFLLLTTTLPASVVAARYGVEFAGLSSNAGLDEINNYIIRRQTVTSSGGSAVDLTSMSVPMRLFTYLFRPLFLDANDIFDLLVSFENLLLLVLFGWFILRRLVSKSLLLGRFEVLFYSLFSLGSWSVLSNTTANLGIAIRQKWMFVPMILVLAFSMASKAQPARTTPARTTQPSQTPAPVARR